MGRKGHLGFDPFAAAKLLMFTSARPRGVSWSVSRVVEKQGNKTRKKTPQSINQSIDREFREEIRERESESIVSFKT